MFLGIVFFVDAKDLCEEGFLLGFRFFFGVIVLGV